jgi:hypothetical protein
VSISSSGSIRAKPRRSSNPSADLVADKGGSERMMLARLSMWLLLSLILSVAWAEQSDVILLLDNSQTMKRETPRDWQVRRSLGQSRDSGAMCGQGWSSLIGLSPFLSRSLQSQPSPDPSFLRPCKSSITVAGIRISRWPWNRPSVNLRQTFGKRSGKVDRPSDLWSSGSP